jgi:hypothetical protein
VDDSPHDEAWCPSGRFETWADGSTTTTDFHGWDVLILAVPILVQRRLSTRSGEAQPLRRVSPRSRPGQSRCRFWILPGRMIWHSLMLALSWAVGLFLGETGFLMHALLAALLVIAIYGLARPMSSSVGRDQARAIQSRARALRARQRPIG